MKGDSEKCLSINNGQAYNGSQIVVFDCLDAIAKFDARELWDLHVDNEITAFMTWWHQCMEATQSGDNIFPQIMNCYQSRKQRDQKKSLEIIS